MIDYAIIFAKSKKETNFAMDLKKVTLAGSLLSVGCAVAAQGAEFRTTTFAERWRDASACVESAKAEDADLRLDIAATDQTVLGFGV